jgi:DNA-binding response OmpR family regulator
MIPKRVLVVDDEVFIIDLVRDFLNLEDILCDDASNSQSALNLLKKNSYDLVLLDRNLESCKAEDFIDEIKKVQADIPIILLTGDHQFHDELIKKIGVDGVIFKPFKIDEFLSKINKFMVN